MKHTPTLEHFRNTAAGRRPDNQSIFPEVKERKRQARKPSKHVQWMKEVLTDWCEQKGYTLLIEHTFSEYRKFRFDFAIISNVSNSTPLKIGIEYHGLQSEKSGHTTLLGFTKDQDKANLAQSEGWKVLAFTVLNYRKVIEELIKNVK